MSQTLAVGNIGGNFVTTLSFFMVIKQYVSNVKRRREKIMHWFDWDRVDTAHEYVKRGTKLTEKWAERTW